MKNLNKTVGLLFILSFIIISGCVDPYDVAPPRNSTPPPSGTDTTTGTVNPTSSQPVDPTKILSGPTWTWNNRVRIKEVDITDNGDYVGGLSTNKVIIKTPDKNLLSNLVWTNARMISLSESGDYFGVADKYYVNLYDREGGQLYSYKTGGLVNEISVQGNGNLLQGGHMKPYLSEIDTKGTELWSWTPTVTTDKVLSFHHIESTETIAFGTQDSRIYLIDKGGKKIWSASISGDAVDIKASDDGGRLYVLTSSNRLYLFDKYGNKIWNRDIDVNTGGIEVTKYGDYVITEPFNRDEVRNFKYKVYLYDKDGYVKWTKSFNDEGVYGISKDAKYVVISDGRELKMYNVNGNEVASYFLDSNYGSFFVSLAMTPGASKIVTGTTNHLLVFG